MRDDPFHVVSRDLRMLDLGLDMTNLQSGEVSGQFAAAAPFRFEAAE